VKTPAEVVADIERRLRGSWASEVEAGNATGQAESRWPHQFPLGRTTSAELGRSFGKVAAAVTAWRSWARAHDLHLVEESRRVAGTPQTITTHLVVPDVNTAANVVGGDWPSRIQRARLRAAVLTDRFASPVRLAGLLRDVDAYSDVDFELLCRAAEWFRFNAEFALGRLSARQVPIEGLHSKWLNTSQHLVAELAGMGGAASLGLVEPRRARVNFTYLDPDYLAKGARRHDSETVGDSVALPYEPCVVLISENKDTVLTFPPVPAGIAVEGNGKGGRTIAALRWVREAPLVVYWGDMDADGLEILDQFRVAGLNVISLLMDINAYHRYKRFGVNIDAHSRPLGPRLPRALQTPTTGERDLYQALCSSSWSGPRRIEQERIPLERAADALAGLLLATQLKTMVGPE